jgi:hypothetical protein
VISAARRLDGWLSDVPFHPWLLAVFPVLRLYMENLTDVEPGELVLPLLAVLALASVGMLVATRLVHDRRRAAIIVSAILVPALSFGLMVEILPAWLEASRYLLLALVVAAIIFAIVVALRVRGQLGAITSALNLASLVLVVVVAVPAARGAADALRLGAAPIEDPQTPVEAAPGVTAGRDIYHLVFDRYGSERGLRTGYGFDNAEFMDWLREQGFQVLDDAHANYTWTTLSMASTLAMSHLDPIAEATGPDSRNMAPVDRRLAENRAGAFLQELGYRYIHLAAWFGPTRDSAIADAVFHPSQEVDLTSQLTELSVLPTLLGRAGTTTQEQLGRHATAVLYEHDQLEAIRDMPGPKYVLAHMFSSHPPYVFLADGRIDPERATFGSQLTFTNGYLRRWLEPLLALPEEERPIIILQADEGPYPRPVARDAVGFDWDAATDEELITKFGILSAWLLPGPEGEAPLRSDMSAINTYPELFRRYFGASVEDAPDRTFASPRDRPYDLTDITERLASAERRQLARADATPRQDAGAPAPDQAGGASPDQAGAPAPDQAGGPAPDQAPGASPEEARATPIP